MKNNYLKIIKECKPIIRSNNRKRRVVKAICICGSIKNYYLDNLKRGHTKSCGCKTNKTHGLSHTSIYKIYRSMRQRCLNKNEPAYKNYGGRGIKICKRWEKSFINFYNDMSNTYQINLTLERIDNNKGYSLKNCKWISKGQQVYNRRNNINLSYNGKIQTLAQWAREINIDPKALKYRLSQGLTVEQAITIPKLKKGFFLKDYIKNI